MPTLGKSANFIYSSLINLPTFGLYSKGNNVMTPTQTEESKDEKLAQTTPKKKVLTQVLDFLRAMRTATCSSPEEAIEWATLEQEFTQRASCANEKAA
jgi:hypothetical protein